MEHWILLADYSERAARKAREMLAPALGANCIVILRPEELGTRQALLTPGEVDGVSSSIQGKFVQLNDQWIVLDFGNDKQVWVPRERVLLFRVEN